LPFGLKGYCLRQCFCYRYFTPFRQGCQEKIPCPLYFGLNDKSSKVKGAKMPHSAQKWKKRLDFLTFGVSGN